MPPIAIPLALTAISTIPQWVTGYKQGKRADQLSKDLVRPEFDIPDSAERALASAEAQARMTRLPGQDLIEGRLDQTTANKIAMIERMSMGGPTAINAAGSAYGQQMDAENELGVQAANMRLNNQAILRNELGAMAGYENQKWNWDRRMPFEQTAAAIEALREGSMRNKNAAWKDLFGSAANISMLAGAGTEGGNWWEKLLSGGGSQTPASASPTYLNPNQLGVNPVGLPATSQFNFTKPRQNVFDSNLIIR